MAVIEDDGVDSGVGESGIINGYGDAGGAVAAAGDEFKTGPAGAFQNGSTDANDHGAVGRNGANGRNGINGGIREKGREFRV